MRFKLLWLIGMFILGVMGCNDASSDAGMDTEDTSQAGCAEGFWDNDGDMSTPCEAKTDCAAGEYVANAGTATTDRVCTTCGAGEYSDTVNAESCTAKTDCAAGEYVANAGTSGADRVCSSCETGEYSTTLNAGACTLMTECVAGEFISTAGTATSDQVCSTCEAGHFSATNAASCTPWSDCVAGEFMSAPGTATADRTCTNCATGAFSTATNAGSCTLWIDCDATTEYPSTSGTPTSDRVCSACTCVNGTCNGGNSGDGTCSSCDYNWFGSNCDTGPPFTTSTIADAKSFALGDVDNDGLLDLGIVVLSGDGEVDIYTQSPARTFTNTTTLANSSSFLPLGLCMGDLQNNGFLDVITAGPDGSRTSPNSIFENLGSVVFGPENNMWDVASTFFYGKGCVTAQMNPAVDTHLDIVWNSSSGNRIGFGTGDSFWISSITTESGSYAYGPPPIADIDNDGDVDVVAPVGASWDIAYASGYLKLDLNDGSGNLTAADILPATVLPVVVDNINPLAAAVGDFDNDGDNDIAFFNYSQSAGVDNPQVIVGLRTSADGAAPVYTWSTVFLYSDNGFSSIVAEDVDADGNVDLVFATGKGGRILTGNGDGTFTDWVTLGSTAHFYPLVEDIDNDGLLDLVFRVGSDAYIYWQFD